LSSFSLAIISQISSSIFAGTLTARGLSVIVTTVYKRYQLYTYTFWTKTPINEEPLLRMVQAPYPPWHKLPKL
jgi:hypothetical protein